jgi:hypothetical protein
VQLQLLSADGITVFALAAHRELQLSFLQKYGFVIILCALCEGSLLDQLQRGHYGAFSRFKVVPIQAATEAPHLEFAEVSLCRKWRCKLLRARHIPILKHL